MGVSYNPSIVTDGLVLCLDAANRRSYPGTGTTWTDLSGNGNNGTLTNGPTFNGANSGGIVFDGANDYISFANTTIGSFNNATFSYGAWFYYDGTSQDGTIISKRNDDPYNQYNLGISNDAQRGGAGKKITSFANCDQNTGGYMIFNYDISSLSAGWLYTIIVINNNNQHMYVNGVNVLNLARTYTGKTFNIVNKPLYVGAMNYINNPARFFKSRIASAFLYSKSLSANEVQQNFNATRGRYGI